ncbi:MAG: tyrosine-protein phosphatase [Anaerolineae bacterium]
MSTPPPLIPSVPNLRDAGGHTTRNGARIRSGILYRSEQLSHVSDADSAQLAGLGLKKIYDLRTAAERSAQPDRAPDGAQEVIVDVLADESQAGPAELLHLLADPQAANEKLGGGKAAALFAHGYAAFVSLPSAREGFGQLFRELAESSNLPALYHCTTGKDRTGWASAALLTLCGISADDVMADYLRSNDYILPEYEAMIDQFVAKGVEKDILSSILGVREEYLQAAFTEMQSKFGTIEQYFEAGLGIDAAGQQALRDQFTTRV